MPEKAFKTDVSQFELSKAVTFSKIFSRIKLTASARLVLRALVDHYNPNKAYCFPKQNTLADETGCSRKSIINAIEELRVKGLILTNGEKGDTLKYYLTAKFFDLIKIAEPCVKTTQEPCVKSLHHEQININKENNISTFKKNKFISYRNNQNQQEGIKYISAGKVIQQIEKDRRTAVTPLDFDKDKAIEYYNKLPEFAKNGFYAKEIKKRYNL